jgi:hypothetical protein
MSDQLTPEKIYSRILKKELEKKDALKLFESLININDNEEIRFTALEFIGKIALDDKKTFEVIESCLITDESPLVRYAAAKILIQTFPKRENEPLLWAIQNEKSIYFFKKLIDLLETYDTSQFKEIREKTLKKIEHHYNLNSNDSKFVLDIDYLDYMKFKTEFYNFLYKFELPDKAKQTLIKENTEIGYKGLGRVQTSKNGYILNLSLIDLVEIPDSICKLIKLESLEVSYCNLKKFPDTCPNLLSLKNLVLINNKLDRLPRWVIEIANKNKYTDKYINKGVKKSEAHVLGILEILTGHECEKMRTDENFILEVATHYELNNLGHITKIMYSSTESRIGVFPRELCSLEFLEELTLIDQNIRLIPETIGRLKRLKVLNLMLNKIENIPESIKKLKNLEHFNLESNIKVIE